jgi:hypothetical protein
VFLSLGGVVSDGPVAGSSSRDSTATTFSCGVCGGVLPADGVAAGSFALPSLAHWWVGVIGRAPWVSLGAEREEGGDISMA